VANLQEKFRNYPNIKIVLGDFFEHQGKYDLIIEQTFFCALPPTMRQKYVLEMHKILTTKGLLVGLLFNRTFDGGPPFGGSKAEYELLFKDYFDFKIMETCHNSIAPRVNTELFFELQKINK
jgi:SAM-dependent methyltransferase